MKDAPERIWAIPSLGGDWGDGLGMWWPEDTRLDPQAEYIRADVARADAELAVAEAIRRGDLIRRMDAVQACQVGPSDEWSRSTKSGYEQAATDCARNILRIEPPAPADALAEVQRLREEWNGLMRAAHDNHEANNRAEEAEAERDAALAQMEKLREALNEISSAKANLSRSEDYQRGWTDARFKMRGIADAALAGTKTEGRG